MAEASDTSQEPPPPYDESTDGEKKKEKGAGNIAGKLSFVAEQAPKLVGVVNEAMNGVANSLDSLKKNTAKSMKACRPSVSMRLNELQTFLMEVVRKSRSYCESCKDLGEYGSDEDVIADVLADLRLGKLEELNDYLEEIDDFLGICQTRYERVTTAGTKAKDKARKDGEEFENKMDKAVKSQGWKAKAGGALGAAGGGVTATGAILTFFCPPAGIAVMIAGVAGSATAVGLSIDAGYSQAQIDIFRSACKYISQLDANLGRAMDIAKDMREQISNIKESGRGIDLLKDKSKKVEGGKLQIKKVKSSLNGLKKKMSDLSSSSDKLIVKLESL